MLWRNETIHLATAEPAESRHQAAPPRASAPRSRWIVAPCGRWSLGAASTVALYISLLLDLSEAAVAQNTAQPFTRCTILRVYSKQSECFDIDSHDALSAEIEATWQWRKFLSRNVRRWIVAAWLVGYTGWHKKSKPLPNDQKIVLNRIKACQWDYIYSSN